MSTVVVPGVVVVVVPDVVVVPGVVFVVVSVINVAVAV